MRVSFSNVVSNHKIGFKRDIKEEEYVNVPLIWNESEDKFLRQSGSQSKPPVYNSENPEKEGSKFGKFKKTAAIVGGGVVAAPTVVSSTVRAYSDAIKNSKESVESGMETLGEIKEKAKEIFHKKETDTPYNESTKEHGINETTEGEPSHTDGEDVLAAASETEINDEEDAQNEDEINDEGQEDYYDL